MDQKIIKKPCSPEFRERAVRPFVEHRPEYATDVTAPRALAGKLGRLFHSLRIWVRQAQRDVSARPGKTSAKKAQIRKLERKCRELREASEILEKTPVYFAQVKLDRPILR